MTQADRLTQPCPARFMHEPHDYGRTGLFRCPGVTGREARADAMRRRAVTETHHDHLVTAHHLSRLSYRAFSGNRSLWDQVHRELHKAAGDDGP